MSKATTRKRRARLAGGTLAAGAVATLVAWGCSSSSEEKLRVAALAGSCSINSECKYPFVCAFARCHVPCNEDRDCDTGLRCVQGSTEGVPVCQLPDEVECDTDRDCPGTKQVCGIDNECRDPCDTNGDCTLTQFCANSGECASQLGDHDHVDDDGNIIVDGGGTGGTDSGGGQGGQPAGGKGGTSGGGNGGRGGSMTGEGGDGDDPGGSGSGGSSPSSGGKGGRAQGGGGGTSAQGGGGGSPTAGNGGNPNGGNGGSSAGGTAGTSFGGVAGTGGDPGGAGGTAGSGGNSGGGAAGASGSTGEVLTEPPDGIETVNNDTREVALAIPLPAQATINVEGSDEDWFSVTPPNDGPSHVISIVVQQNVGVRTRLEAYTLVNYAGIDSIEFASGSTGYAYVTAGPGATILFRFLRGVGAVTSGMAHLSFDVEAENDANEPNDTKLSATPIATGMTYSGIALDPWVSNLDRPAQDWFAVTLVTGTLTTVSLTAVPSQGRLNLSRVAPSGATTSMGPNSTGATRVYTFTAAETGTYNFVFEPYSGITGFSSGAKPTYLTEPYSFTVTQP
jgi:hypothetical protein